MKTVLSLLITGGKSTYCHQSSYTHPLWGGSISVGGEYTYTNRHDDYVNQEGYVPTTYTRIREQNLAGYAQYSHPLPFGQANIGLRYEHVDFDYFEIQIIEED